MLIESKQIKEVLIKALEEYRVKSKTATNEYARASLDNVSRVLETLLVFINESERNEEALDMSKLQSKLVQQMVSIDDIEIRRRTSELEDELIKIAEGLTKETAAIIDNSQIKYGHLSTKISNEKSKEDPR